MLQRRRDYCQQRHDSAALFLKALALMAG